MRGALSLAPDRGSTARVALDNAAGTASNRRVGDGFRPRVVVDLRRVRANAQDVVARTGVPLLAVVKADAYGLGMREVAVALADVADGFCVLTLAEAAVNALWASAGKPIVVLATPGHDADAGDYRNHHARPAVASADEAQQFADADPLLSVDVGMQRFACPAERVDAILRGGLVREAFTHATRPEHVEQFVEIAGGRGLRLHAAGSSLLGEPRAYLDAVRPGLALYQGAARVAARLVEVRESSGPIGYTGWRSATGRHGVILAGYSHGLRAGPCLVNGQPRRVPEVGMQSAFVELGPADRPGDEVVLLGDSLTEADVAAAWGTSPHEALVRLCRLGVRSYLR
jgi:alanine racemase